MKEITITKDKYREAVARVSASVMADHSKDHPDATLMFSLASITFAGRLEVELFKDEVSNETVDPEPFDDSISPETMREELDHFCKSRGCNGCPLNENGFICGRGYYFTIPYAYMDDGMIAKHYKRMKEYKNER